MPKPPQPRPRNDRERIAARRIRAACQEPSGLSHAEFVKHVQGITTVVIRNLRRVRT